MIIGVDHGYSAMKTAHICFLSGIVRYEHPQATEGVMEDKLEQIRENQVFPCENLTLEKHVGEERIQVSCQGENSSVFGGWKGEFRIKEESRVTRPTEHIRRVRVWKEVTEGAKNGG